MNCGRSTFSPTARRRDDGRDNRPGYRVVRKGEVMAKSFWIKERHNPQLGVYYVACGQMTIKEAKQYECRGLYGENFMHKFSDADSYRDKLRELKEAGA